MIRNLPVIVAINIFLLLINLYLLKSSSNQLNDGEEVLQREKKIGNELNNLHDLNSNHQKITDGRNEHPTTDSIIQVNNTAMDVGKTNGQGDLEFTDMKGHPVISGLGSEIYQRTFYDQRSPHKERKYHDWSLLRQVYRIPLLPRVDKINCKALLAGNNEEMFLAKDIVNKREFTKVPVSEETYLEWTQNCASFKTNRGYITVPLTMEEQQFPIAFSISMFTDVEQMERLLRAVYQPHNLYCIHVDVKSSLLIHKTVKSIVNCFDNVFMTSQLSKVKWGDVSVLLPHLSCMRDLVKHYRGKWKYFMDLAGQEFPLRTNYEIVQILNIFNGSNDITASHRRMEQDRIQFEWTHRWSRTYQQTIFYNTFRKKEPPPFDLTILKGEIHGLFSHLFVEYIVESPQAQEFLRWCWNTSHASEHYWNTLNFNRKLNVPGGYYGNFEEIEVYSLEPVTRAKHWQDVNYVPRECQGKLVRGICVYGIGDVPWLASRKEIIANKFHLTFDYFAMDCLEERHRNRTITYIGSVSPDFDKEYYTNLPTVKFSRKDGL